MSNVLNSRLKGLTYSPYSDSDRTITIRESIPGLAAGYVTVEDEEGRWHNENLVSVLSAIAKPEPFRTAYSLLNRAEQLREIATELAAMAVSYELPSEAETLMSEMDTLLGKALQKCDANLKKAKRAIAGERQPTVPAL
ncbi:MAG: hypothetical protein EOR63_32250 [Mesorhizobium sp.]|nr:MAG: hypothetical protein EOR63_32250 [Mesorhizobium sp.]